VQLKQGTLKADQNPASKLTGTSFEWELEWELMDDQPFGLKVGVGGEQETVIRIDPKEAQLTVDRTRSGVSDFEPRFAEKVSAPIRFPDNKVKLRVYMDVSTLEVFANDGETVLSSILFPDPAHQGLELFTEGKVKVEHNTFYPMKSVWKR
jgi:fructan beta-fructosidase